VPINPPEKNCRTTNAHLATIYSREKGKLKEYRNRIYKARWVEDLDIEDPNVLIQLGEEVGLKSKEIKDVINEKPMTLWMFTPQKQNKSFQSQFLLFGLIVTKSQLINVFFDFC